MCVLSKPGGGNVTDRESNPRPLGASSGDSGQYHSSKKVSCDEWYWNPSPDSRLIYRDICVERGASYAACCSQHPPRWMSPMNDPDTCTSYQRSRWTRCWIIHDPRFHARMLVDSHVLPGSYPGHLDVSIQGATIYHVKTRRWECDRPGVEPTFSGCIVWEQYHSSEKVSCDEWYWNPSPDISGYMCGARHVVRGLLLTTCVTNII